MATASGVASESARRLFGFARAVPTAELLAGQRCGRCICTFPHDSHARYVVAALANQKPVLVEKPLAINREQLDEIRLCLPGRDGEKHGSVSDGGLQPPLRAVYRKIKAAFSGRQEPWWCKSG